MLGATNASATMAAYESNYQAPVVSTGAAPPLESPLSSGCMGTHNTDAINRARAANAATGAVPPV